MRTKENIARVRRDEAKAAEEERQKQERAKLAEREARTELLRQRARNRLPTDEYITISNEETNTEPQEHVNFFKDLEEGVDDCKSTNVEHDKEKKEEQEQYEKKIGYLTYLGQDTNESLGKQSWYNIAPERSGGSDQEVNMKSKINLDPLNIMKKFITKPNAAETKVNQQVGDIKINSIAEKLLNYSKYKKKKRKHSSDRESKHKDKKKKKKHDTSDSDSDKERIEKQKKLEQLRNERLKRERDERLKVEKLFSNQNKTSSGESENKATDNLKQKYNSQFNPEIAKQNYFKK